MSSRYCKLSLLFTIVFTQCLPTTAERNRIKFDFDYLFTIIPTPKLNCSHDDFPNEMNGMWCDNLMPQGSAHTLQECADICCADNNCQVYQWCSNSTCNTGQCWVGVYGSCHQSADGWITRSRTVPALTPAFNDTYSKPAFDDSNWRPLNIPHDYIVEGEYSPDCDPSHGYLPKNISWYRKWFNLPKNWQNASVWISFDGIYRYTDIYLNGVHLGHHSSGYTSFHYYLNNDVSPLYFGDDTKQNILAIRVNPILNEGWWYEGAGMYRHVWITKSNHIHIQPWGVYVGSNVTAVNAKDNKDGNVYLDIQTNLTFNATFGPSQIVSLQTDIFDKSSQNIIATNTVNNIKLSPNDEIMISQKLTINNVKLWSIYNPELHIVYSTIIDGNSDVIDSLSTTVGFRKVYFDVNGGLYLNDEFVKVNGFCNHQDFGGCGTAVPDRVNRFKVESILEIGANAWRMSHNPPNIELLDFADEYGMLVWDENKRFANNSQYFLDQMDMIHRDKNHPSIIIWSLCNENECMVNDANAGEVALMFKNAIHRIDNINKRPVSAAMNGGVGDTMSAVLDIQGINYNMNEYNSYHSKYPNQAMISSENSIATTTRNQYTNDKSAAHSSSYKNVSEYWIGIADRSFIAGVFYWTGFDYRGETSPWNWPQINSLFGVFDIAGFKKDDYWYYRSIWQENNETIIYLFPNDWNQWRDGAKVSVWIYSNVAYIDLQLNNKSVSNGLQPTNAQIPNVYNVLYERGTITAIGYDMNKMNIGSYSLSTSGEPYAIELIAEYPSDIIYSDGQDVVLIQVLIVDINGVIVPYADNMLYFSIEGVGVIYGVANGDDSCHEPDKAHSRSAFHGKARVIVQSIRDKPGDIQFTATSQDLLSKTIIIYSMPAPS